MAGYRTRRAISRAPQQRGDPERSIATKTLETPSELQARANRRSPGRRPHADLVVWLAVGAHRLSPAVPTMTPASDRVRSKRFRLPVTTRTSSLCRAPQDKANPSSP